MKVRSIRGVLAAVAFAVALGACSSDDSSSSDTTEVSAAADICTEREALRGSVEGLADVDLVASGTSGLEAALTEVKDDLQATREAASSELQPEVQAVEEALQDLESAVADLGSGGASALATAAKAVGDSASTLLRSLDDLSCP